MIKPNRTSSDKIELAYSHLSYIFKRRLCRWQTSLQATIAITLRLVLNLLVTLGPAEGDKSTALKERAFNKKEKNKETKKKQKEKADSGCVGEEFKRPLSFYRGRKLELGGWLFSIFILIALFSFVTHSSPGRPIPIFSFVPCSAAFHNPSLSCS